MSDKPILIHTHFHKRRTGVTRSVENVFPYFFEAYDSYIYGFGVQGRKISLIKLLKLVFKRTYFVVHCHRNNEMLRMLFFKVLGGNFKMVSTRHAESKPSGLTNFLLQKSDVIVSLTKSMQESLPYPTTIVGHGVDVDTFKPKSGVVRKEISQKNILTCAGRVRKSKGQKVLLEVFGPILKKHADWALVIVGKVDKPEFLVELKAIVAQNGIEQQVYFIKETPEIISYYQASHSVIIPSFSEGFSLVCAEAMACGCNTIATRNVGVHSEMIQENVDGYLFDVENTSELKTILEGVCTSSLQHLGSKARTTILEKWSSKIEAEKLMEIYKL